MNTRNRKFGTMGRNSHHLWSAHKDDQGKISVVRSKIEPESFENQDGEESGKKAAMELTNACWGLWGASLVDEELLYNSIPQGIVDRLNVTAKKAEKPRRVYEWKELRTAFGEKVVDEIRKSISDGMRIRIISKYLNTPFIVTADLVDHLADTDKRELKDIIDMVRSGHSREATKKFGSKARIATRIYSYYSKIGSTKLAIDEKAKRYFEDYYGPFGKEMVREIKRRVRADLVNDWMRKNGVDEAARDYWKSYLSNYGEEMVKALSKKLTPS